MIVMVEAVEVWTNVRGRDDETSRMQVTYDASDNRAANIMPSSSVIMMDEYD